MIGKTLGHYRIVEKIGAGGMGVVYKAQDLHLDRSVALKILPPVQLTDLDRKRRFVQEAKAASALNHPGIIHIYDIASDDDVDFIAMEYIEGKTLDQRIGHRGLAVKDALRYAVQIADALAKAHSAGIIHRDLKPSNIMVNEDDAIKILDFGLAKLTEQTQEDEFASTATVEGGGKPVTEAGVIMGTVAYMSPEQAEGRAIDARSDIFSFGSVLYEMVTGRRAFQGTSRISVLAAILRAEPMPSTDLPADLTKIVARCLRQNPGERFQAAADLKHALEEVSDSPRRTTSAPSIAVLPFANLSADKENEYFSDGLAEEIINALTQAHDLRVTARTSSFSFRGKEADIREIGSKLNVDNILEGSVRRAGNRIRVTAQLINAQDGYHLWSERYDREMIDVFAIQDEISLAIANKLRVHLVAGSSPAMRRTENLPAYDLYLEGRYHLYKWTPEGFSHSKECLEKAISLDPEFAQAYDALAELYWYSGFFGIQPPKETFSLGIRAAHRALEIDDSLAEAHANLGMFSKELDYDWSEVAREFARALQLNPASPTVRQRYVVAELLPQGRLDEAIAQMEIVLKSDPLSLFARWWLVVILALHRKYDAAIDHICGMLELDPNYFLAYLMLGLSHGMKGAWSESVAALEKGSVFSGRAPMLLGNLGWAYAQSGQQDEARKLLVELAERARTSYVAPYSFASIHIGLCELDEAFAWLEKGFEARDPLIVPIKTYPHFDPLRGDPRYHSLLRRMHLEA